MTVVTILGAGGKMGNRVTKPLLDTKKYELRFVEKSEAGQARIREAGLSVMELDKALKGTDVVIFTTPDALVRQISDEVVPKLDPGTKILFLDPAAIAASRVKKREDISCFVCHPTHPPVFSLLGETDPAARRDYWGGGLATQALVFAIAWGTEEEADLVETIATEMFAPISQSHRITVEQMALLEPALSETLINGCIEVITQGLQKVIDLGVPEAAAKDFCMGHLQISIALLFEELNWKLSDGALMALKNAQGSLFRDDWDAIFKPENVLASVKQITGGDN
jgi:hypothetical protein